MLGVLLALGALLIAGAPAAGAEVETPLPGPVAGWSTTTGTDGRVYIADEQGRALQFHGFNRKTTDPDSATDELMDAAVARGMDHMRLAIYWDALEPEQGKYDEKYLDKIVAALDRAERHGLLVILDMHQDVYGPAFADHRGIPEWATRTDGAAFVQQESFLLDYLQPAVQNAFDHLYEDADLREAQKQVWLKIVDRVKDNPALLGYDLLNEPFGKLREGETLFSAAARVEATQLTPMYQRLTDAISAVDADHWVFFEPPNLASLGVATSLGEVTGPKVAVYPHMYDASIESATYTEGGVIEYDPTFFGTWRNAITTYTDKYAVPMLVGEWGLASPETPGLDQFVRDSLNTMDASTSGWSVFNWCMGGGYCPIDENGQDRPNIGQIFQPYARAIAGAPTRSNWDYAERQLTVTFDDNGASDPTNIFITESRSYPEGWVAETSDTDGSWTQSFDQDSGVLSIATAKTGGEHTICVKPAGSPKGCRALPDEPLPAPESPGMAPDASMPGPALPAIPIPAEARFTG